MKTQNINHLKDLKDVAQKLVQEIKKPQVVLFQGPLSVGKTQLIRFMGEFLGVSSHEMCSPSFSLINIYAASQGSIAHIDLFRLKSKEDLESTGFWDVFISCQVIFIEWSDLLKDELPQNWNKLQVNLQFKSQDIRLIEWQSY